MPRQPGRAVPSASTPRKTPWGRAWLLLLAAATSPLLGKEFTSAPLTSRSSPAGSTLFTELPPTETGIVVENNYADSRMWSERYQEFTVGAIGTGIAIGDVDGDKRPDVFVASKTEKSRLFRNKGGFAFEDVTDRAGLIFDSGVWTQGAVFADVDNDGDLDLYICRFGAPNLLYINQGDGRFQEEAEKRGVALISASGMATVADYDRDGWLDLFVQTNLWDAAKRPAGEPDVLYRNRGDGSFEDATSSAGISGSTQGHSAMWWDFDHDGWLDLYVANDFAAPDALYRNNRDGTFTDVVKQALPHTPYSSMGSDAADLDNDGLIDLLAADMAGSTHEREQRGSADSRTRNRDPKEQSDEAPQYQRNALYLATGTTRCLETAYLAGLAGTDWTWAVRLEDFDNDGRTDAFFTNGMVRELDNVDLLARMMTSESAAQRFAIMRASPVHAQENLAYRNGGELRFEAVGPAWGLARKGVSFAAATGDLDNDGDLDLVVSNFESPPTVLRNDSRGNSLLIELRGAKNRFGIGARVEILTEQGRQTKTLLPVRGYMASNEPVLHFGLGSAEKAAEIVVYWPDGKRMRTTDIAAHQRVIFHEPAIAPDASLPGLAPRAENALRFVESAGAAGLELVVKESNVEETQRLLPIRHNRNGPRAAAHDFNGDGRVDFVLTGTAKDPAQLLLSSAGGGYSARPLFDSGKPSPVNDGPAVIADFDGDGDSDVILTKGGSSLPAGAAAYQPRLLLNRGSGGFEEAPPGTLPAFAVSIGAAVTADFDRDGRPDVFIGGRVMPGKFPSAPPSALMLNRGEKFENVSDAWGVAATGLGMVTGAVTVDLDRDGWIDLVTVSDWGRVVFLRNTGGAGFEDVGAKHGLQRLGHGQWSSLATADLNGDGRPDFVVGNVGLNTAWQAGTGAPATLFYGRFRENAAFQIVAAQSSHGALYPLMTRRQLGAALPAILKNFPRNDDFAKASVSEIFGEAPLSTALRLDVTELRSGFLLSRTDGSYEFSPAPRLAQVAPWQSVACGDFDGDGDIDAAVAQNSYSPIPYMGRHDGGLGALLINNGKGAFQLEPLARSGLSIPGDPREILAEDVNADGMKDLFVTRNNQSALLFIRQ